MGHYIYFVSAKDEYGKITILRLHEHHGSLEDIKEVTAEEMDEEIKENNEE